MNNLFLHFVDYLGQLRRSRFVRNVALVASGSICAQAVTIISVPLITRLYGPEAFGILGAFTAVIAIAGTLSALAYPIAIVLPRSDDDALLLVRLSVAVSIIFSLAIGLAVWWTKGSLVYHIGIEALRPYVEFIPIAILFLAWTQISRLWLVRKQGFHLIAYATIFHSLLVNGAKIGVGYFQPLAGVLIGIATFGHAIHSGLLSLGAYRYQKTNEGLTQSGTEPNLWKLAKHYRDFPFYRAPQNFINAISQNLPVLMLAALFGPSAAGFYALAKTIMGKPSTLLGKAVTDVFYPKATEIAISGANLTKITLKATATLALIAVPPFGIVIFFGPELFSFVFGENWRHAGYYAQWLSLFFFFNFINKPAVACVPVIGIQKGLLLYELFSTGGKILGLLAGFYFYQSDIMAVALFSIIGIIAYAFMIGWILYSITACESHEKTS